MTKKEACRILGVMPDADRQEIKKRYRQMMRQVHPDGGVPAQSCRYPAHEVNLAYEILCREPYGGAGGKKAEEADTGQPASGKAGKGYRPPKNTWDAPLNPNAYREREILHYVEDQEGNILGNFCIARGKYLWKTEEDFPLFLLSMYRCGKELLDEIDEGLQRRELTILRQEIQPELTYLLSQQFIDGTALLGELAREKDSGGEEYRVFYIPAMLELSGPDTETAGEEALFPSRLRKHRLFLKDRAGQELGYLSFWDDRMYYVVIPLFEQKRARVRIRVSKKQEPQKRRGSRGGRYRNLDLWIKVSSGDARGLPESLNLQIDGLLRRYERV